MTPAEQAAAFDRWLAAHPAPPRRPMADAELAAEDYWASVGEQAREEAMYASDRDMDRAALDWENAVERRAG